MSEPKLISPLLDGFTFGAAMSSHHGVSCYPAIKENSDTKYIVKTISLPASQVQLEALLLTGAYKNPAEATEYFREQADKLVDEAQFLRKSEVHHLSDIADELDIPVIAFGLKTDFRNQLFEGSKALLELADAIDELKTVCQYCNKKATLNMRMMDGKPVNVGETIQIGDEEYVPVCRKCYKEHLPLV